MSHMSSAEGAISRQLQFPYLMSPMLSTRVYEEAGRLTQSTAIQVDSVASSAGDSIQDAIAASCNSSRAGDVVLSVGEVLVDSWSWNNIPDAKIANCCARVHVHSS